MNMELALIPPRGGVGIAAGLAGIVFAWAALSAAATAAEGKRPNVIVFFSDQQRWDTVGCYGQELPLTPHLDRMAAEGVRFQYAFTAQPVCGPICSSAPTSGRKPLRAGIPGWYFPDRTPDQLAAGLESAIAWMDQHPEQTTAERVVLLYAWNELGEGGCLAPTIQHRRLLDTTPNGPRQSPRRQTSSPAFLL